MHILHMLFVTPVTCAKYITCQACRMCQIHVRANVKHGAYVKCIGCHMSYNTIWSVNVLNVIYCNCHSLYIMHTCMWHAKIVTFTSYFNACHWCDTHVTDVTCMSNVTYFMIHWCHTCHWLLQIVGHKYIIAKLVWVLLFLTGICVFGYFSYKLIIQYRQYETATDVQVQELHNILLFIWVT